mmetsp:Transcript_93390/g.161595  ORF Transcript_93390/g.161595 Transcript_93390/m.161595 type:complete len:369 (+) Transcript_93390:2-1108(+)
MIEKQVLHVEGLCDGLEVIKPEPTPRQCLWNGSTEQPNREPSPSLDSDEGGGEGYSSEALCAFEKRIGASTRLILAAYGIPVDQQGVRRASLGPRRRSSFNCGSIVEAGAGQEATSSTEQLPILEAAEDKYALLKKRISDNVKLVEAAWNSKSGLVIFREATRQLSEEQESKRRYRRVISASAIFFVLATVVICLLYGHNVIETITRKPGVKVSTSTPQPLSLVGRPLIPGSQTLVTPPAGAAALPNLQKAAVAERPRLQKQPPLTPQPLPTRSQQRRPEQAGRGPEIQPGKAIQPAFLVTPNLLAILYLLAAAIAILLAQCPPGTYVGSYRAAASSAAPAFSWVSRKCNRRPVGGLADHGCQEPLLG